MRRTAVAAAGAAPDGRRPLPDRRRVSERVAIDGVKLFVTGGGRVHRVELRPPRARPHRRRGHVFDALTYAGNRRRRATSSTTGAAAFVHADICDQTPSASTSPGTTPSSTSPPSRTSTLARSRTRTPFVRTNCHRHVRAAATSVRQAGVERFHHISTDEVYGDLELDDPERFTEADAVQPVEPVLGGQGRLGPARPGVGAIVRRARRRQQLLEQPSGRTSTSRSSSRCSVTNLLDGGRSRCTAPGMNVRDWIHVDDHSAPC